MKKRNYLKEIKKGNYALALTLLDQEIAVNPNNPELLYNFAICCSRTGNDKKCITVLKDLLSRFERFIERDNIYQMLIFSLVQIKEYDEALTLTDERLKIQVGDLRLLSFRAHIMEKLGKIDDAIQIHRNILKLNPDYVNSLNSAGYLLARKPDATEEDLKESTDYLKKALSINPDSAAYLDSFGVLLQKRGRGGDAKKAFQKAIAVNPAVTNIVLDHIKGLE